MSVDGKISPGASDDLDVDKDFPNIDGLKEGLHQYYEIEQTTDYPWDGKITLTIKKAKAWEKVVLHIPNWCDSYNVKVNGETWSAPDGSPINISRKWKKGDRIELTLDMPVRLVEANPLVEEAKNQIAVMRGPIVYCLEGQDIEGSHRINDIAIPADILFTEKKITMEGHEMIALEGDALLVNQDAWDNNTLYRNLRPMTTANGQKPKAKIRLIPYYAWDNRGIDDMSLWLPLAH